MLAQIPSISLILTLLISQRPVTPIEKHRDSLQDAWLYSGPTEKGAHLTYSDFTDWSDLWKTLTENGFYTAGRLCIKGVFVLYQEPFYQVSKPDGFEILTGKMNCKIISENTKSIQLVGSVGHMQGPTITFFEKPHFGSTAFPTANNVGRAFFQKMEYTRSAIIAGTIPWTITLSTGETFCVKPEFDESEKIPACLIRDFATLLDIEMDDDDGDVNNNNNTIIISKASLGCKNVKDEESIHRIQDCLYWGSIEKPESSTSFKFIDDEPLTGRNVAGAANLCKDDNSAKRVITLYKSVIKQSFDTSLLVGLDTIGKHSWKLDLVDWIFTIVKDVVPDLIVPSSFFNKVRELFVHKLVTAWNKNGSVEYDISDKNYKFLLLLTEQCDTAIVSATNESSSVATQISDEVSALWNNIQSMEGFKDLIIPEFRRAHKLDIIMEIFWIAGHMTLHLCHVVHMSTSHFWALYLNTFWHLYVLPVVPNWGTRMDGLDLYFGGLDRNEEYNKLAMFVGITRKRARHMELLQRPESVKRIM